MCGWLCLFTHVTLSAGNLDQKTWCNHLQTSKQWKRATVFLPQHRVAGYHWCEFLSRCREPLLGGHCFEFRHCITKYFISVTSNPAKSSQFVAHISSPNLKSHISKWKCDTTKHSLFTSDGVFGSHNKWESILCPAPLSTTWWMEILDKPVER